jgi:DNA-binding response OmpR family regulator
MGASLAYLSESLSCPCCTAAQPVLFYDAPRIAIIHDRMVLFSRLEYALLRALCGTPALQSCSDLAIRLHGVDATVTPAAVRVLVCRLRRKLADRGVLGMVQTVRTHGDDVGGYVVSLGCLAIDWEPPE